MSGIGDVKDPTLTITVAFPTEDLAVIAYRTLSVDREPPRGSVQKHISLSKTNLVAIFSAKDVKNLRTAVNKYLDYVKLTVETIQKFG